MYSRGLREREPRQHVPRQDDHQGLRKNVLYQSLRPWLQGLYSVVGGGVLRGTEPSLDDLARLSFERIDTSIIDTYLEDMKDDERFLRRKHYLGHKDDHPPWAQDNDNSSVDMQNFAIMAKTFAKSPHQEPPWRQVDELFRLLFYLQKLQRFLDTENPQIQNRPLPDGSNIGDPDLRAASALHQAWIDLLVYGSLPSDDMDTGLVQYGKILIITRAQQE